MLFLGDDGGYFHFLIVHDGSHPSSGDWIKIHYYVQTGPSVSVSAWVTDSDGNYYYLDVTIIYGG